MLDVGEFVSLHINCSSSVLALKDLQDEERLSLVELGNQFVGESKNKQSLDAGFYLESPQFRVLIRWQVDITSKFCFLECLHVDVFLFSLSPTPLLLHLVVSNLHHLVLVLDVLFFEFLDHVPIESFVLDLKLRRCVALSSESL